MKAKKLFSLALATTIFSSSMISNVYGNQYITSYEDNNIKIIENLDKRVVEISLKEGNSIIAMYDKNNDGLILSAEDLTYDELRLAEKEARRIYKEVYLAPEILKLNEQLKKQGQGLFNSKVMSSDWMYHSTTSGSTEFAKHTTSFVLAVLAGAMGLSGTPGALLAAATWIVENKLPTVYYTVVKYYKKDPFRIRAQWTWYKDAARKKVLFSYTTEKEYYMD